MLCKHGGLIRYCPLSSFRRRRLFSPESFWSIALSDSPRDAFTPILWTILPVLAFVQHPKDSATCSTLRPFPLFPYHCAAGGDYKLPIPGLHSLYRHSLRSQQWRTRSISFWPPFLASSSLSSYVPLCSSAGNGQLERCEGFQSGLLLL